MPNTSTTFDAFFQRLTNGKTPHAWQRKLGEDGQFRDRLIRIPTGMGKTLGVLATWLLRRVVEDDRRWPTRLVWCLPMRTLVEQTKREAVRLVDELAVAQSVRVQELMGGVDERRWYDEPETPMILIGTQDMLLSRALNRGYAMWRAAWPRAFGLLNTDALWVMDEVQLMGVGLTTSAQLQAFATAERELEASCRKPRVTWWMSATLQPSWLETRETAPWIPDLTANLLSVAPGDRIGPTWEATKPVERIPGEADGWAALIVSKHLNCAGDAETGRQTLVVVNTVRQACELYGQVRRRLKSEDSNLDTHLVHSRFRAAEREAWIDSFLARDTLTPETDRILIATQVVEAGIDISATCLMTELAPWPSLVQRFGRAARYGGQADVFVLDQEHTDEKKALPYALDELAAARHAIDRIADVSIGKLEDFEKSLGSEELTKLYPYDPLHVLLRHEFEELFDTSPDLSGADMDISRFIRDGDEARDVQVFWRAWTDKRPPAELQPTRRELCSVPIGDAKAWIKKATDRKEKMFRWDYLVGEWVVVDDIELRPGMFVLVHPSVGGYSEEVGFTGTKPKKNESVAEVPDSVVVDDLMADAAESSEATSKVDVWKTIASHCREAADLADEVASSINLDDGLAKIVRLALRLHDWGKAHPSFASGTYLVEPLRTDLAKAPDAAWRAKNKLYDTPTHGPRRGFRHELASGLAVLELLRGADPLHPAILGDQLEMLKACGLEPQVEAGDWSDNPIATELLRLSEAEFNLLLYLIVSHHGKVRASLQASPKDQQFPVDSTFHGDGLPIRGVRDGDELPAVLLPTESGEQIMPNITLSLAPAAMGLSERYGRSWAERIESLLANFGPITLGYLEAIVRSADGRASDDTKSPGRDPDPALNGIELTIGVSHDASPSTDDANEPEVDHV